MDSLKHVWKNLRMNSWRIFYSNSILAILVGIPEKILGNFLAEIDEEILRKLHLGNFGGVPERDDLDSEEFLKQSLDDFLKES